MTSTHRAKAASVAAALVLALTVSLGLGSPAAADPNAATARLQPLILVMDTSGSMDGERLARAKDAAVTFIDNAAIDERVGLFTYPGGAERDGCAPGTFRLDPLANGTPDDARVAVSQLSAGGNTPTGPALESILRYMVDQQLTAGRVVLISDGEANCGTIDICDYADEMAQRGVALEVSTVSFDNTQTGNAQLQCIAQRTGGTYTDAKNWEEAERALRDNQSYRAELTVTMPDRLTSSLVDDAQAATIAVTPTGRRPIPHAKLVLTFTSMNDTPGKLQRKVWVERPVRRLGNLAAPPSSGPVVAATQTFPLRPEILASGDIAWTATLLASNVPIAQQEGVVRGEAHAEAGRIFEDAERLVVLGDSYSSGEGTEWYHDQDSPNRQLQLCHRSGFAYGWYLADDDPDIIACSGAVTEHFRQPQVNANGDSVPAQLVQLAQLNREQPADVVVMTIGGNDAGFAAQIEACAVPKCDELLPVNWQKLERSLTDRYTEVNAVLNNKDALARRGGKVAQIVVVPYVDPIPLSADPDSFCFPGVDTNELALLKQFPRTLNQTIGAAVRASRSSGVPIQVADRVVTAFSPDHQLCSDDPYLVVVGGLEAMARQESDKKDGTALMQELMHPTIAGHQTIALNLLAWARTAQPMPLGAEPALDDVRVVSTWGLAAWAHSIDQFGVPTYGWATLEPGRAMNLNRWCPVSNHPDVPAQCQWARSYPVTVRMNSFPTNLGTFVADENGRLPFLPLPLDTPPGAHTLMLDGFDASGVPISETFDIYVWPEGTGRALDLLVLSALLGSLSGLLFGIDRLLRRRRFRAAR